MSAAIVVDDLRFAWPEGDVLFDGLSFASAGRFGSRDASATCART